MQPQDSIEEVVPVKLKSGAVGNFFLASLVPLLIIVASCAPPPTRVVSEPSPEERLDQLLAPIALYPDPLLAVLLPSATVPFDVVLAARFVRDDRDPLLIDDQPWEPSVRALAHYPDVVTWLDENIDWTTTVGDAFRDDPESVMRSIQRLRREARAAGNLVSTPQQIVVMEDEYIRIIPADQEVMYVPEYDPDIVYVERPRDDVDPIFYWGHGWRVGVWQMYDCDWHGHRIWMNDWHPGWEYRSRGGHEWREDHDRPHAEREGGWRTHEVPRPKLTTDTPKGTSPGRRKSSSGRHGRIDVNGWGGAVQTDPVVPHKTVVLPATPQRNATSGEPRRTVLQGAPAESSPTTPRRTGVVPSASTGESQSSRAVVPSSNQSRGALSPVQSSTSKTQSVFGGYERGSDARDASTRGAVSRQAPTAPVVRSTPQPVYQAPPQRSAPAATPNPTPASRPAPAPQKQDAPTDKQKPRQ